ncbi:3-oxoacyl-ACP synthase III family protein [Kitasatospora sp. NPDC048239]|uniref:3-oxoacyl-ACP synthase III family protein n=1 Tax=Kitasatospora sp. NPDC048239 TaxID=3364046 RepID=UPI003713C881
MALPARPAPADARDVRVLSVGTALPGAPVDNLALARRFGQSEQWAEWVDVFVGTRTRHLALDLERGTLTHSLADLATTAAVRALAEAGLAAGDVDALVLGTATPDLLMPGTVNIVADRLGLDQVPTFQLQSGCTGAFQAIALGRQLLLAGEHHTVLVIGGDVCSRAFDLAADVSALPPEQLVNAMLFGDGAGAVVLSTAPVPGAPVVRDVFTRLVGLGQAPGQTLAWFGPNDRDAGTPAVSEDYKAIEARVPVLAEEIYRELLERLDWKPDGLNYLLPPQLSGRMTRRISELLGNTSAAEISVVTSTGNNGNGLPFLQLEQLLPQLAPGERALAIAVESSKWIKAGFALEGA